MPSIAEIIKPSTDPAAGVELSWTADEDCIIHTIYFSLATSAVAANRVVGLVADDGNAANIFWRASSNFNHAASLLLAYSVFEAVLAVTLTGVITFPLPAQGLRLEKGWRVRTLTTAFDPGDNYSAMTMQVERQ